MALCLPPWVGIWGGSEIGERGWENATVRQDLGT